MLREALLVLAALALAAHAAVYFEERFDTDPFADGRWVASQWKAGSMGKWAHTAGSWQTDAARDLGIQTTEDMKHHAVSAKMPQVVSNAEKPLVVQFTVKHEKKEYSFCGGGYIKLLPSGLDQAKFGGDSPYSIMFGPDLCGYDVSRIHAIFTDKNGKNLLKKEEIKLDYAEKNEFTHLYTLIVNPDHTFKVLFDNKEKASGSILDGWEFPARSTDDPTDTKPGDWVDEKQMPDPAATKPADWDQPEYIADPDAEKPDEWDEEMDGEWEAPQIKNPKFKGEWKPPMIDNPAYKGAWKARQIPNPDFYEEVAVYPSLEFVGFELWTVNNGSIFDNVLVTDDVEHAAQVAKDTWQITADGEKAAKEAWERAKQKEKEGKGTDKADASSTPAPVEMKVASEAAEETHEEL